MQLGKGIGWFCLMHSCLQNPMILAEEPKERHNFQYSGCLSSLPGEGLTDVCTKLSKAGTWRCLNSVVHKISQFWLLRKINCVSVVLTSGRWRKTALVLKRTQLIMLALDASVSKIHHWRNSQIVQLPKSTFSCKVDVGGLLDNVYRRCV